MSERVFLFRWTPADRRGEAEARECAARLRRGASWLQASHKRGLLLLYRLGQAHDQPVLLSDEIGAVFGVLFERREGQSARLKSEGVTREGAYEWAESGGAALITSHWGNYLAVLHDHSSDDVHVLRDPAGSWPVFHAKLQHGHCVFTHAEDFIWARAGACRVDGEGLKLFLAQSRLAMTATGIEGVEEMFPGERLTLPREGGAVFASAWRPRRGGRLMRLADVAQARIALKDAIIDCAQAWRSVGPVAHRLSGGLDSSAALAALCAPGKDGAGPGAGIVAINERPRAAPEGDESVYARLVARALAIPLVEIEQDAGEVDYRRLLDAPCAARPALTELSFASGKFLHAAEATGARVLTSGQGGDQVFQRGGAIYFPCDALGEGLRGQALIARAVEAAQVSRMSVWRVLAQTLHQSLRRAMGRSAGAIGAIGANPFWGLHMEAAIAAENQAHPWAADSARASPARAYLIRNLADIAYYHRPSQTASAFIQAPFLAAQPVIELVLSMPSYFHALGGVDRAMLRGAFAEELPPAILARRTKGDTTRHFARVAARNLALMRALLIDGALVRAGLLDRWRVEAALKRPSVTDAQAMSALLNAFVAETWMRRFARQCSEAAAQAPRPGEDSAVGDAAIAGAEGAAAGRDADGAAARSDEAGAAERVDEPDAAAGSPDPRA